MCHDGAWGIPALSSSKTPSVHTAETLPTSWLITFRDLCFHSLTDDIPEELMDTPEPYSQYNRDMESATMDEVRTAISLAISKEAPHGRS